MNRWGIRWKYFFYFTLIIIITTAIVILIASSELRKNYINELELSLQKQAEIIGIQVKDLVRRGDFAGVDALVKHMGKETGTRITIIKIDGMVVGESEESSQKIEDHATRPEVIQALNMGIGKQIRFSTTTKEEMVYIAIPVKDNGKILGVIRTSAYFTSVRKTLRVVNQKIIYTTSALIVFALFFSVLSSNALIKTIKEICLAAENIKNGEFSTRIFLKRKDEFSQLANSINDMAESLHKLFNDLTVGREEIKTILSSMVEGLVVLDEKGKIVLANDNFRNIAEFAKPNIEGKFYWEVLQNVEFDALIKRTQETAIRQSQEIQKGEKIYFANAVLVSNVKDKKIIIVLHDITDFKNLERVKADFVANLSHELKTPLTSIKGFAETLEEEIDKKHQPFVETIKRNTDRLISIVQDLLIFSELERKERKLEIESVDLKVLVHNVLKIFTKKLKEKKLSCEISLNDDASLLKADPFWIEQVFINLIDNAVKYNTDGGKIKIDSAKDDGDIKITIEDTGIGIAKEHLLRIFERFYVVDKSRSRKLGGTGLGLSIVKHIVLAHNGKVEIESEVGKGTKFIVKLPKG
jgi:two-component system phosphate regulon sensor histidine kinase PhoR